MQKKMFFPLVVALFCFLSSFSAWAQPYSTAVGVRLFPAAGTGLSVMQRIAPGFAVEGIGQMTKDRYTTSAMFKWHNKILFSRAWNYYFGAGGHYGGFLQELGPSRTVRDHFYGANLMIGSELTLGRFNIAFDYMPSYAVFKPVEEDLIRHDVALSLRIVLFKAKKEKTLFDGLDDIFKDLEKEHGGGGKDGKEKRKTKEM